MQPRKFPHLRSGQGAVEYALILALVAVLLIVALGVLGVDISNVYTEILSALQNLGFAADKLFADSFENGLGQWEGILWGRATADSWYTQDGKLWATAFSGMLIDNFNQDDYVVQLDNFDMHKEQSNWQGVSVFFRASQSGSEDVSGYAFRIQRANDSVVGEIYFSQWANGYQLTPKLASVSAPPGFDWEGVHDIQVHVEGNTFTGYIDGVAVLLVQDNLYTQGTAGVFTHKGTSGSLDAFEIVPISQEE